MSKNRVRYTLLNRILNINSSEWPRVMLCFFVRFFHRFGFVVGWTVIVALLVSNYGIQYLPYLFIVNGLFILLSGSVYSRLVRKFKNSTLLAWTVVTACVMIFLAVFLIHGNTPLLFLTLVFAESFFLFQLNILISAFTERFFTPLSSQRTFPFIESAETIAVLLAGLLIASLANSVAPHNFFYVWVGAIFLVVPFVLGSNILYGRRFKEEKPEHISSLKNEGLGAVLLDGIARARKSPFLMTLVFIVLFQWLFVVLMEFQYTKAVSASVMSGFDVPHAVSSTEHALVHALGSLQILFGGSALLIQILIGSRIITSLGVVSGMLLYPVIGFLSLFGLTLRFSFATGVLAKNNTEMANVLFKNTYHSAFYALPDKSRELSREFLEGFVRPFSAVLAMSFVIGLQALFKGEILNLSTNVILFVSAFFMFIFGISARKQYTESAASFIFNDSVNRADKLHAVEILGQKGHKGVSVIFSKALKSAAVPVEIKEKIIEVIGDSGKPERLPLLLDVLNSGDKRLLLADLRALSKYSLHEFAGNFTEYRMIDALMSLFGEKTDFDVKKAIIENISEFDSKDAVLFLINALKKQDDDTKAEILLAMRKYPDVSITHYVEPFLDSKNPKLRTCACVPLWQFHSYKTQILSMLSRMLSGENSDIAAAVFAIAEIGLNEYRKKLNQLMDSSDMEVSICAAYALARLGYLDSCEYLVHLLLYEDTVISQKVQRLLQKVPKNILKHINRAIRHETSQSFCELEKAIEFIPIDQ